MVYRFDFGDGYAVPGYIKIKPDTIYKDETGYGIEKKTKAVVRSRGENKLLRDYLLFGGNRLIMRANNGVYNIRVYSGDYNSDHDLEVKFYINDREINIKTKASAVGFTEAEVEVADFRLEVRACEGESVYLNAVELSEKQTLESAEVIPSIYMGADETSVALSWKEVHGAYAYRVTRLNKETEKTDVRKTTHALVFKDLEVSEGGSYVYTVVPVDILGFELSGPEEINVEITK